MPCAACKSPAFKEELLKEHVVAYRKGKASGGGEVRRVVARSFKITGGCLKCRPPRIHAA
jgi:hypothetical protein